MFTKAPRPFRTIWICEIGGSCFQDPLRGVPCSPVLDDKVCVRRQSLCQTTKVCVRREEDLGEMKLGKKGGWGAGVVMLWLTA